MEDLLTVEQAAAKLQVTPRTIKNWLRTGRLKGYKVGGRIWRLKESDLEMFLEGEPTEEDLADAQALEDALKEGRSRPYEDVRRELGL